MHSYFYAITISRKKNAPFIVIKENVVITQIQIYTLNRNSFFEEHSYFYAITFSRKENAPFIVIVIKGNVVTYYTNLNREV